MSRERPSPPKTSGDKGGKVGKGGKAAKGERKARMARVASLLNGAVRARQMAIYQMLAGPLSFT